MEETTSFKKVFLFEEVRKNKKKRKKREYLMKRCIGRNLEDNSFFILV